MTTRAGATRVASYVALGIALLALAAASVPASDSGSARAATTPDARLRTPGCHVADRQGKQLLCVVETKPLMGTLAHRFVLISLAPLGDPQTYRSRVIDAKLAARYLAALPRAGNGIRRLTSTPNGYSGRYQATLPRGRAVELWVEIGKLGYVRLSFRAKPRATSHFFFPGGLMLNHYAGTISGTVRLVGVYLLRATAVVVVQLREQQFGLESGKPARLLEQTSPIGLYTVQGKALRKLP